MTGAEFLLRCLRDQGLGHVFLVPGGHIDPLVAELGKGARLRPVVAAHEEGAGFMADGYARVSGRFGACLCIGGPGAGNLLPAAIAARSDRSRVLFITGDVPTTLQGRGAFQDGSMEGTRDCGFLGLASVFSEEVELISQLPRQLAAARKENAGVAEMSLLPEVDWAAFARVLGAEGARVEAPQDLAAALRAAAAAPGPYVLDVVTQRDCLTPVSPFNTMAAEYAHAHHD
jgi:thiamine pyrophosphate-dependent acetolactate synthase large subunit-like protein